MLVAILYCFVNKEVSGMAWEQADGGLGQPAGTGPR